eukprot:6368547-Pyramimonas_sp.AAC.2
MVPTPVFCPYILSIYSVLIFCPYILSVHYVRIFCPSVTPCVRPCVRDRPCIGAFAKTPSVVWGEGPDPPEPERAQ